METVHTRTAHRIGLVVPSSNTTMEIEIPALMRRQRQASGGIGGCSFHTARLRLREVRADTLRAMNDGAAEAAESLCDADVDVIAYACLVAAMVDGRHSMEASLGRLATGCANARSGPPALVTSAHALIAALHAIGARNVAMITPYRKELAASVAATLGDHDLTVRRLVALEVTDNLAVGRLDQVALLARARELDLGGCDALVISACVQMPSLDVLETAEREFGLPVLSAATATAWALLRALGKTVDIAAAGSLLRGSLRQVEEAAA